MKRGDGGRGGTGGTNYGETCKGQQVFSTMSADLEELGSGTIGVTALKVPDKRKKRGEKLLK